MDRRANVLARRLIADGAGPESLVAVNLPRWGDQVVARVAGGKNGGGYVAVAPPNPAPPGGPAGAPPPRNWATTTGSASNTTTSTPATRSPAPDCSSTGPMR
ncbi:hypothetical protein [Nocardia brasiliensis]|uniref:hypothetical protein n=1 Tax=Nocardia brasiliensis TaxID=37326 RepID=UPI003D79601A